MYSLSWEYSKYVKRLPYIVDTEATGGTPTHHGALGATPQHPGATPKCPEGHSAVDPGESQSECLQNDLQTWNLTPMIQETFFVEVKPPPKIRVTLLGCNIIIIMDAILLFLVTVTKS